MRRPDHPDLLRLIELVDEWDRAIDDAGDGGEKDRVYEMIAADKVDPQAASYVGMQRALRAYGVDDLPGMVNRMAEVARGTTLWMEGVLVGVELERRRSRG